MDVSRYSDVDSWEEFSVHGFIKESLLGNPGNEDSALFTKFINQDDCYKTLWKVETMRLSEVSFAVRQDLRVGEVKTYFRCGAISKDQMEGFVTGDVSEFPKYIIKAIPAVLRPIVYLPHFTGVPDLDVGSSWNDGRCLTSFKLKFHRSFLGSHVPYSLVFYDGSEVRFTVDPDDHIKFTFCRFTNFERLISERCVPKLMESFLCRANSKWNAFPIPHM